MVGLLSCCVCGIGFCGRSDAVYCSSACRQKAHRGRAAQRIAALIEPWHPRTRPERKVAKPEVADTIQRARNEQRRARDLCRAAVAMQRRARASQQLSANRSLAPVVSTTASPPWSGWAAIDRGAGGRS